MKLVSFEFNFPQFQTFASKISSSFTNSVDKIPTFKVFQKLSPRTFWTQPSISTLCETMWKTPKSLIFRNLEQLGMLGSQLKRR